MTVTAQQLVNEIMTAVTDHDPYVFGGISLIHGADCSGEFVGAQEALGLPHAQRTSQEMFSAWKPAPGPALGVAVFFNVPSDGTRPGDQPGHVGLCLNATTMEEEPHTGLDAEVVKIPNIPGVESIMGYRYVPGLTYGTPATTTTPSTPAAPSKPAPPTTGGVFMIPSNCSDVGALRAQIREWWVTFRSDVMLGSDSDLFALVFTEPAANKGYGGDPDLLLAGIIDDAKTKGALRPQFVNAV